MMKRSIFRILALCAVAILICGMTACTPQDSAESSSAFLSSKTENSSQETSSVESNIEYKEEEWRLHPQDYKLIAFTFDDGPEGIRSTKIIRRSSSPTSLNSTTETQPSS